MPRSPAAVALAVLVAAGCASLAKKTPTPADQLRPEDLLAEAPPPGERYYLLLFGAESHPKRAKYTHSWATIVRVADGPPGCAPAVDPYTISWMPTTLDIHPLRLRVEPGTNLDLDASLRMVRGNGEAVAMWGPYQVWYGVYRRFLVQKEFLESGRVGYQCIDSVGEAARTGDGCDCIHAVTDLDLKFARNRYPLRYFGQAGTRHMVGQIMTRPIVIDPPTTHDWLIPALGLDRYPIDRREYRGRTVPFSPEAVRAWAARTRTPGP